MNKSKAAIAKSRTTIVVEILVGLVMLTFFGTATVMYMVDPGYASDLDISFFIVCLVLDVIGLRLVISARNGSLLLKEFRRYVAALPNVQDGSIPCLAAYLGTPEEQVRKNLERMMKKRFFANAYIDSSSNCVVISNRQNTTANPTQPPHPGASAHTAPATSQSIEMVTVKCKGCGGINTLQRGMVGVCDYCGSSIKGE